MKNKIRWNNPVFAAIYVWMLFFLAFAVLVAALR